MLILLPPSEGKSEPINPQPLSLESLSYAAELSQVRLSALKGAGIEVGQVGAGPAMEIYSGVLYKALDWASLPKAARTRGLKAIRIISSVYGIVSPVDHIAPYKMKFKSATWKRLISEVLIEREDSLIVDCRSSPYTSAWTPPHDRTVAIRVFGDFDGEIKVITHMSKKYRGEVTRLLLLASRAPRTANELKALVEESYACNLIVATNRSPHYLDIVVRNPYS